MSTIVTLPQAKSKFLESISLQRSDSTLRTYSKALETFLNMLSNQKIDISTFSVADLSETSISDFVIYTKNLSPATESLYLQVIKNFFEFLYAENLTTINVSQVRMLIRQRTRRIKIQNSEYPEEEIKILINAMHKIASDQVIDNQPETLLMRDMRDSALILTLADTGLRVEEVCKMKVGDIDWINNRTILKGQGGKQSIVRFSTRAIHALKTYLDCRSSLDRRSGRNISTLPLFARHDKGAGNKIKPVTSATVRNIVGDRVNQYLGAEAVGIITPHTFLHYFITTILRSTGNLKLAQVLARHSNIQITQKYAHLSDNELDMGYYEIFEKKTGSREE
jgi:site-specific recombinase XerD